MKLSGVEFRPCNVIQFERSTQLLHLPGWVLSQTYNKKSVVQFCVRVVERFEPYSVFRLLDCCVGILEQFVFNNAKGICHLIVMVSLLAVA
jgi:hypothetical protein